MAKNSGVAAIVAPDNPYVCLCRPGGSRLSAYRRGCRCYECREYVSKKQKRYYKDKNKRDDSNIRYRRKKQDIVREIIQDLKSEGCVTCGEMDSRCLDMHHTNPSEKRFLVGLGAWSRNIDELIEESKKCIVLCANCHRKLHYPEVTDGE